MKNKLQNIRDHYFINKYTFLPYDKNLTRFARENRLKPTPAEAKMWDVLCKEGGVKNTFKFTRQKPIDHFILDFYCSEQMIGIEIDGEIHNTKTDYDNERSDILFYKYGIFIIRYTNAFVLNISKEKILKDLLEKINYANNATSKI